VAVNYSTIAINARLSGVVSVIDGGGGPGRLQVFAGVLLLASVPLGTPSGTVASGVLTFTVPETTVAVGTGTADNATVTNAGGLVMISGLTVGIPMSGANLIVSNGLNTLLFTTGQAVTLLSGQIIGS
jgi:hypothetical protein